MCGLSLSERAVPRSTIVGNSAFSAFSDYETHLLERGVISNATEAWTSPELVETIQRHWFWQGQAGCIFARRAARYSSRIGWLTTVFTSYPDQLDDADLTLQLGTQLLNSMQSPRCELMSFIFPQVRTPRQLLGLVRAVSRVDDVALAREEAVHDVTALSFQVRLAGSPVMAWLLGFGPFAFMPATRRAPSVEIIVRPKQKPPALFHRVNQDRSISHVADVPLYIADSYAELVWQETLRSVERVLGHRPDRRTAATTTFCLPSNLWAEG
jgi:hypothetical protein